MCFIMFYLSQAPVTLWPSKLTLMVWCTHLSCSWICLWRTFVSSRCPKPTSSRSDFRSLTWLFLDKVLIQNKWKNKKMTLLQRSTFVCLTKLAKLDFLRILISVCGLPALTENTSFRPLLIDISPHCHLMEYRDPNHPNWVICWWRIHGFGSVRKPSISYYPKHAMSI